MVLRVYLSKPLKVVPNPGGSGALMWFSNTGEYVIKTVDRGQGNIYYLLNSPKPFLSGRHGSWLTLK